MDPTLLLRHQKCQNKFFSSTFQEWAKKHGILIQYIQPGKPAQNGFIERFNRTYRQEILDAYIFDNLSDVRKITKEWMVEYNHERPHAALNGKSPIEFARAREGIPSLAPTGVAAKQQHEFNYSTYDLS